jgi:hypothetical protein
VFLACGTGVVPGLQAARAVLDRDAHAKVTVLWSVRGREELEGVAATAQPWWKFWSRPAPIELSSSLTSPSPVGRQFEEMKAKYQDRLHVQVAVTQEHVRFGAADVQKALMAAHHEGKQPATTSPSNGCQLHDQRLHEGASEFETPGTPCACPESDSGPGKNVLMVCGPEGFVSHYAGPKIWEGGHETQGPVGGVAAQLLRQNPQLANDWLVLKL